MVDMDRALLKQFVGLQNAIAFGKKSQQDFNAFVLSHQEELKNPHYLQVFAENVELFDNSFYEDNYNMCEFFYDFMTEQPLKDMGFPFGLRTAIRLGTFMDEFEEHLLNKGKKL